MTTATVDRSTVPVASTAPVRLWTGRHARALRAALRLTNEGFAQRLGDLNCMELPVFPDTEPSESQNLVYLRAGGIKIGGVSMPASRLQSRACG